MLFISCAHFFGVSCARISKKWLQVMAILPCYAIGLAAMHQFVLIFVRYACMRTIAKYAAGYAKFPPLKSNDFGVFTYLARLATPNADWESFPGFEPTQRINSSGWHRNHMLLIVCFARFSTPIL